ncbi:MAG: VOC family protein [Phycisphaerales bacterium]|nr:VOC family protein [Phycisphaerales bacterium]MCB9863695.1 VOC family protein [Phycisphaerales bacterium]
MGDSKPQTIGSVTWRDLTVNDAEMVRRFYEKVVGWKASAFDMSGYSDYVMEDASGAGVAGVCHARGANANLPPQWLIYITVEDVAASAKTCIDNGGAVLDGPRKMSGRLFAVIRDPAGAVAAIIEPE